MRRSSLVAVVFLPWLLACSPPPALPPAPPSVSRSAQTPANDAVADARVAALEVVEALKRRDMVTVARHAHPTMGGAEDGTGFPIERTPAQYYERFVFPRDFTAGAKISVNDDQAKGNAINNAASLYPDGVRVEFYLPPTETPEGPLPDWRALRLVFVAVGGEPKLVAVVHDQWTI